MSRAYPQFAWLIRTGRWRAREPRDPLTVRQLYIRVPSNMDADEARKRLYHDQALTTGPVAKLFNHKPAQE